MSVRWQYYRWYFGKKPLAALCVTADVSSLAVLLWVFWQKASDCIVRNSGCQCIGNIIVGIAAKSL
jgi:hypothetical protein